MPYLTHENYLVECARHYDNRVATTEDFLEDIARCKYVKKLLTRYIETGELKERLILNHIIILNNVFGPEFLCRMLFLKMQKQLSLIKPFLVLLNVLPERVYRIGSEEWVYTDDIPMDDGIVNALRTI